MVSDTCCTNRHKNIMHTGNTIIMKYRRQQQRQTYLPGTAVNITPRAMFFLMVILSPIPFSTSDKSTSVTFPT